MEQTQNVTSIQLTPEEEMRRFRIKAGAFLGLIGGVGALAGFSRTMTTARRQDQKLYETATNETVILLEQGTKLATRALAWGTLYAFLGVGTFCFGVWKLSGATNFAEFRQQMGSNLPRLTKDGPATSRTEFENLTDLMQYASTWGKDEKNKSDK